MKPFDLLTLILFLIITTLTISVTYGDENMSVKTATFAGGCFWCMEPPYKDLDGVIKVVPGYTGGHKKNPSYADVSSGRTGHFEAVQITYDPTKISYAKLLDVFWMQIDPTDLGGQFADRGSQYQTAIFYHDDKQKKLAQQSKDKLQQSGRFEGTIVTKILPASTFYEAENYHHEYYKKNSERYQAYKRGSGREGYIKTKWGDVMKLENFGKNYSKPSDEELKKMLTPLQYKVTQKNGTERPFDNEYWDNKKEGIYVDIVTGEPLFSSLDKFESGTGWPSFTKTLVPENIKEVADNSLFMRRTEVRSKHGDSHLGHVFNDGPEPTGLRYCVNSAALKFIPKQDLAKKGYGEFQKLFEK